MFKPAQILAVLFLFSAFLSGCAQYDSKRGVAVVWQAQAVSQLVEGKSTRADVLDLLGPPSQVIALKDETVFYYLFEHSQGEGLVLIVYNRVNVDTRYDRAIFFFDDNDILTESATHIQAQEGA